MCLSPIKIGNRSRRFADGFSRTMLLVPCGHCAECQKNAQDEWFVRAFWEYKDTLAKGGDVFFTLLTYDEEHVEWYEDEVTGFTCPCFNPKHYKTFRDTFRTLLLRDRDKGIIDCPDPKDDFQIKFKFCCEYGGDKGRPHLHLITCIPFKIRILDYSYYRTEDEYLRGRWNPDTRIYENGLFKRSWNKGFVSWSKKHGMRIKSEKGIQYSMKYVSKDQEWMKKYGINEYIEYLKDDRDHNSHCREEWYEKDRKLKDFRRVLPRHFTSSGFGVSGIDMMKLSDGSFDIDLLVNDVIDLTSGRFGRKTPDPKHPNWSYHIPRYIKRKIMYNLDEFKLWSMNEIGLKVVAQRFAMSKAYKRDVMFRYSNYNSMIQRLSTLLYTGELHPKDVRDDFLRIQSIMKDRTFDDLLMYDMVYRGIPLAHDLVDGAIVAYENRKFEGCDVCVDSQAEFVNSWIRDVISMNRWQMMKYFRDREFDFYLSQKSYTRNPDPKGFARCKIKGFYDKRNGFEIFDCFKGFDDILDLIDKYELKIKEYKQQVFDLNESNKKAIFDICCPDGSVWLTT